MGSPADRRRRKSVSKIPGVSKPGQGNQRQPCQHLTPVTKEGIFVLSDASIAKHIASTCQELLRSRYLMRALTGRLLQFTHAYCTRNCGLRSTSAWHCP
jgi:hypothetical protein